MSNNSNFVRKISYVLGIGVLLIPLSMVALPATRNTENEIDKKGGKLAQLRDEFQLSQARLMEIDPASETMKLASLGLRGVAVNMLWMQAIEHKKKEQYDQMASTLKALTKIQPNFVKVWEYQGHNLSYNISMEFDDYEYRYHWVKKGIAFLKEGVPYNRQDHRMLDTLGFFTGLKIGRSDEKNQFRRMFREDYKFHDSMSDYIEPDLYDTREYRYDNWMMAYYWYDLSRKLVATGAESHTSSSQFYAKRPAQLRNQAQSLNKEFRADDIIQEVWRNAFTEWDTYGKMELQNTLGVDVRMEDVNKYFERQQELEAELDALGPEGLRAEFLAKVKKEVRITPLEEECLAIPPTERNDMEYHVAKQAQQRIEKRDQGIDLEILQSVAEKDKRKAKEIYDELALTKIRIGAVGLHDSVNNYGYWKTRNKAEADELMVVARQMLYDAEEMRRQSIFDDEIELDPKTKKPIVIRKGAISLYEEAYAKFYQVFNEYPLLREGGLSDDVFDTVQDYKKMLEMAGRKWPYDFPLQNIVDARSRIEELYDNLPTSEMLEERRSLEEGNEDDMSDENEDADPNSEAEDADSDASSEQADDEEAGGDAASETSSSDDGNENDDDSTAKTNENSEAKGSESKKDDKGDGDNNLR